MVLGFLGWRAIRNEKSYSLERLQASYRQSAALAARQMDYQLSLLEARWVAAFDGVLAASGGRPTVEHLREFEGREPLISEYFFLDAHGRVVYPPGLAGPEDATEGPSLVAEPGPEFGEFARMVARGEDLEYGAADLPAALAAYREIARRVSNPRLLAVTTSHIGRVQLKMGDAAGAVSTYRRLLQRYPEVRDLDRMYLRFLAQYQIAAALEQLDRPTHALETLVTLQGDLVRRGDAITALQFSYYHDLVQTLSSRLLVASKPADRARYAAEFQALADQGKKRINEKYFLQLLDAELSDMSLRQKRYTPGVRYMTARAEGVPFVLVHRAIASPEGVRPGGILAAALDLQQLQQSLFAALRGLDLDDHGDMAIVGPGSNVLIGADAAAGTFMAAHNLSPPFESWQVAVYLQDVPSAMRRLDVRHTLGLWLISLMMLSVLLGGYLFVLRAKRQAFLARAQTTFVSNVTHELRTPLASIRMFAELLELELEKGGQRAPARPGAGPTRYLAIIRQECDRLSRLIERVLDFSRMERQVRRYREEPHDIASVVTGAVEAFRPGAEARGFALNLSVEESLPPVRIDKDAIAQVLWNLLTNAVQFSAERREIHVRVFRSGPEVRIDIADRGIGIEPRNLSRIFDRFYSSWRRMDDHAQGGLGLGLTLSREIVRHHGGEIAVTSTVGRGSTFTVSLPALAAKPPSVVEMRSAPLPDGGTVAGLEARGR